MYIAYFSPKSGLIGNLLLIILGYFGNPAWGYNLGYSYVSLVIVCTLDQKSIFLVQYKLGFIKIDF